MCFFWFVVRLFLFGSSSFFGFFPRSSQRWPMSLTSARRRGHLGTVCRVDGPCQSFRHQRSDHHDLAEEPAGQLQTDYCVDPVTFRARRSVRSDTGFFRAADHDPFDRSKQEAVQWISRNKRKDDEVYCGASQNEKAQFVTEPVVAQTLVWTWTIARRHVRWLNNIYN